MARDVGKERQKTAPEGWGRVRPWWGTLNMRSEPPAVEDVSYLVFVRLRSRLEAWCIGNGVPVPNVLSFAGHNCAGVAWGGGGGGGGAVGRSGEAEVASEAVSLAF